MEGALAGVGKPHDHLAIRSESPLDQLVFAAQRDDAA